MAASISSSIIACLKSFNEFIEGIQHLEEAKGREIVAGAWEDELGRLRMWAANIGAHQTGQSSLDFRLRDASHVREQIIKLLQSLLRKIQDARDVLAEDEESDDGGDADDLIDEEDPKTEIQELQESIATTINCLFQMSMLVRKPTQHDVHLGSKRADVAAFEPFDYNHVREKFPRADDVLVKRLGNAITRRRRYLKYREWHAIKLRQGIDKFDWGTHDLHYGHDGETVQEGIQSILSDTVATNFQQQHQNIEFDDNASDTGISQTSYASTLLSGGNVTVPPPPTTSLGAVPFECPFCFYLITAHEVRSWNKHVFQDLQPYICIVPTCATPDKLYPTRHEWLHHSNTAHPTVTTDHSIPKESKDFIACALCKEEIESGKQYDRHLARHLQELALFILPGSEEGFDVREGKDAESISSAESVDLATSENRSELSSDLPTSPTAVENPTSSYSKQKQEDEEEQKLGMRLLEKQKLLGPEHPDTLAIMATLASSYSKQGRHEAAIELRKQVMLTRQKVLGPEHPATLTSMVNLASSYSNQRKSNEAIELRRQVMLIRKRVLGPEHPDTLVSMTALASAYRANGQFQAAQLAYVQALDGEERTLGPDHPSTLATVYNLGSVYRKQGELADAETMYQRVLKAEEKKSNPDARFLLSIVKILGDVYKDQHMWNLAEQMYQRALDGYEKKYGRKHAFTIEVVNNLSSVYRRQGRLVEAENIIQWALD